MTSPTLRKAAVYARVSTARQAEADLSIPDQISHAERYCATNGLVLVERFIEPGASGTDEKRPVLQRLMDAAASPQRPFDIILVHSMSRFFRDQFQSEFHLRKLRRVGVTVVSMTQNFEDNPTGQLIRQVVGAFDEYQSRENAKHTLRAMRENAAQGFWNGSLPPFGYTAVEAERRGAKIKKRLKIDEAEAPIVRRIFGMALGKEGPQIGVKAIATRLNAEGVRMRGKLFHIANVHRILTASTYSGEHHFNCRDSKSNSRKPPSEWVRSAVPAIIAQDVFDRVQVSLASRNPKVTPARVVSPATLLTGLAVCGTCSSGMTVRTGKSGKYRYYACAGCAQKGPEKCPGRAIPMATLDTAVLDHLSTRLFTPDRLTAILAAHITRGRAHQNQRGEQLSQARRQLTEAEGKVARLLQLVENGDIDLDDPQFKDRLARARQTRRDAHDELDRLTKARGPESGTITPAKLRAFASTMESAFKSGDPAFQRAYVRQFVSRITVSDHEIRITGPIAPLAKAAETPPTPREAPAVPSFIQGWRALVDSNHRPTA